MVFKNLKMLVSEGFEGFKTIEELLCGYSSIPKVKGVYMVLRHDNKGPEFVQNGVGGYFKGKNPNVAIDSLKAKWVDDTAVLYIGKAGAVNNGQISSQSLEKRIRTYLKFGMGLPAAHYGGRYIWQLKDYKSLTVCWKALLESHADPRDLESELLNRFCNFYGKLPFANLRH